jgi:adenine-specific DNA-methyltransferase
MIQRRKSLAILTRKRLLEVGERLKIVGLSGRTKDQIIDSIATKRSVKPNQLLELFRLEELRATCLKSGLDGGGRSKGELIARLLNEKPGSQGMAKKSENGKRKIEQYDHKDKTRANNPPVGLVTPRTDPDQGKKTYQYDPHLDPQLVWAGKAERCSFEIPTVSLHVHERIDPRTIIRAVQKQNGDSGKSASGKPVQKSLFEEPEENPPLREAVDFYKHAHGWSNRLIAGDSLVVMNSLLEKEGMAGKVQMVFLDPPYGIKYGSNFQPFTNKRDVEDGKDQDLTQEPEMLQAFRDTWELGIHSYLTGLRDRLLLARELLHESGSVFLQIGDENLHRVRALMDEVFGAASSVAVISFAKTVGATSKLLPGTLDFLVWYARSIDKCKYHPLLRLKEAGGEGASAYTRIQLSDGTRRPMTKDERRGLTPLPKGARIFTVGDLTSSRVRPGRSGYFPIRFDDKEFLPPKREWSTHREGIENLKLARRIERVGQSLGYVRFLDDFPAVPLTNMWTDTIGQNQFGGEKQYVVQTGLNVVRRCMLMTTDPGDLVLDPTCGSGTTTFVAEQWGRRWITCDTSRVAVTLAKQRLMTALFDYYDLSRPEEGVSSGFKYRTIPHVTLKSVANNPEIREGMTQAELDDVTAKYAEQEVLYDQPEIDTGKTRVTGPFTMEAVPAPVVRPVSEVVIGQRAVSLDDQNALPGMEQPDGQAQLGFTEDASIARYGETYRQRQWRDELFACGIRGKGGQRIEFSRLEPLSATKWLQCEGETKGERRERVVVCFGPEHAPLEQRQVEMALEEAGQLKPSPQIVAFATFQFDPEAAKDIDETRWPGVTLLKVQMNTDLLTEDLKKNRSSNESYWLMGQPDVELRQIKKGEHKGLYEIEVHGFDYYNTRTGSIESGDTTKIAMWMLDTDYDGRSLFPRQVFFPMAGPKDGWARLAKNLKAEIDEELIEAYRGTVSLPFNPGDFQAGGGEDRG